MGDDEPRREKARLQEREVGRTAPRETSEIPLIDYHATLSEAGFVVSRDVRISGDPFSERGMRLHTGVIQIPRDAKAVVHARVAYLMTSSGIKGTFLCRCEGGDGSCAILSTESTTGDPALVCETEDCNGSCILFVKIPSDSLNVLVVRALGVDLSHETQVLGDLRSDEGALITADVVRLKQNSKSRFVEGENGGAFLQRGGGVGGGFDCSCSKGGGSCKLDITTDRVICTSDGCSAGCSLVVTVPKLTISRDDISSVSRA